MKTTLKKNPLIMATLFACSTTTLAANLDTTSREYKVLLDTTKFTYGTEASVIETYSGTLATTIEQAIIREVTGSAVLDKERIVTYWDVPSSCELREINYSFRDRSNIYDDTDRDAALKYRNVDRFISGYEDLSTNESDFETKMEEDILVDADYLLSSKHSHSTKINQYSKTINKFDDIYDNFPGFETAYGATIDSELSLVPVSGVQFYERRYEGQTIDLGQFDADVVISLWYTSETPSSAESPVVAEVSFDYADPEAQYTQKVVQRAETAVIAIAEMDEWVNLTAQTKTDFAYNYDPDFCATEK